MTEPPASIAAAAAMLARGEITARTLLDQALERLGTDRDRFHAMLALNPRARQDAAAADLARSQGTAAGPLHGIPLVLKDNIDLAGVPTTSGCRALAGAMPRRSARIVERLQRAGAVIVGKTNLSEFSFEIRSRSSLGGDVLNPRAPHASAGGSSGGTAVAVVRGYALGGIGTDTGGSIRIPAAYNGLVGFRPAHGALPMQGIAPLAPSTDTVGPIARTVEDAELLLAAMGHPARASALPRRIGVMRQVFGTNAAVDDACATALDRLAAAGVTLVDLPALPADLDPGHGDHIVDAEFATAFDAYLASNFLPGSAPPSLDAIVAGGAFLPDHAKALAARIAVRDRETASILARHRALADHLGSVCAAFAIDALVYPTSQAIPDDLENPRGGWAPELAARSGWPALTVCAGFTANGMPVGIEFLAPVANEGALFALARLVETTAA
ncbi:MAG: hypothetical protein ABT11_00270 [Novosphingobium sp. SCN 66-18]|nr:MAG: hypothetical protein ABT11_00270 [Novosphingobium sp. SCN 66-18]